MICFSRNLNIRWIGRPLPFVAVLLCIQSLSTSAERTEHFDGDPLWEGHNNRTISREARRVQQNFGYSATTHADGEAGEFGGLITAAAEKTIPKVQTSLTSCCDADIGRKFLKRWENPAISARVARFDRLIKRQGALGAVRRASSRGRLSSFAFLFGAGLWFWPPQLGRCGRPSLAGPFFR